MSNPLRKLCSAAWFGTADKNGFMYRSWMKNQGIPDPEFQGKPVIGICNTWSELTPCNAQFRKLAGLVKRGVFEAGGFPVEFPVFSNGESNRRPTAMFTRNQASIDIEGMVLEDLKLSKILTRQAFENAIRVNAAIGGSTNAVIWAARQQPGPADAAGYRKIYVEHVLQADEGCDFDFLVGCRSAPVPRHSH